MGAAEVQEINRMLAAMPSDWVSNLAANRALLRGAGASSDQVPPNHPDAYSVLLALNLNNKDGVSSEAAVGQDPPDGITVPADVKRDAMMGVRASYNNNYGGYNFIGVARAIQLVVSNKISKAAKNRMRMYFDRKTKQDRLSKQYTERKGKRYWSWLNWGGDAGARWSGSSRFAALELPVEQANPVRLFSNPERKDSGHIAAKYRVEGEDRVSFLLYDSRETAAGGGTGDPAKMFIGYLQADCDGDFTQSQTCDWEAYLAATKPGYGPMLYTFAATMLGKPLKPSVSLSAAAEQFWGRQKSGKVSPMDWNAFRLRFGETPETLLRRDNASLEEVSRLVGAGRGMITASYDKDSNLSEHIRSMRSDKVHVREAYDVWSKPDKNRIEDVDEKAQKQSMVRYRYAKEMRGERALPKKNPDDDTTKLKSIQLEPTKERVAWAAEPVQLAPDLRMHLQITRTGCRSYITHWEQREMVWISDAAGRKQLFYRSFSGTSGKTQGRWYVTPGPAETAKGGKLWLVKGSPVKDPGYGRSKLLAFENRVNEVLPHTDADVDAWITRLIGIDGDFSHKDQYEAKATIICIDPTIKHGEEFLNKYGDLCVHMWKINSLDKQWGVRDIPYPESVKKNPIPELTKGSKTKYKEYNLRMFDPANKKMGQSQSIVPWQREHEFTQTLEKRCGLFHAGVWYRLGSGEHWVGVCGWDKERMEDGIVYRYIITLQPGKSWSIAENKVMRWLRGEDRGVVEQTGAGGLDFLKFAAEYIQKWVDTFRHLRELREEKNEKWLTHYVLVGWADEKRRRVYGRLLTKIGFTEWEGDEHYGPCYLLVI